MKRKHRKAVKVASKRAFPTVWQGAGYVGSSCAYVSGFTKNNNLKPAWVFFGLKAKFC